MRESLLIKSVRRKRAVRSGPPSLTEAPTTILGAQFSVLGKDANGKSDNATATRKHARSKVSLTLNHSTLFDTRGTGSFAIALCARTAKKVI